MVIAATIGTLAGAALGTRYMVLILFPATFVGIIGVAAIGLLCHMAGSPLCATAIIFMTSLQLGYLAGAFSRMLFAEARQAGFQVSAPGATARRTPPA
jgi:hypothetical protein